MRGRLQLNSVSGHSAWLLRQMHQLPPTSLSKMITTTTLRHQGLLLHQLSPGGSANGVGGPLPGQLADLPLNAAGRVVVEVDLCDVIDELPYEMSEIGCEEIRINMLLVSAMWRRILSNVKGWTFHNDALRAFQKRYSALHARDFSCFAAVSREMLRDPSQDVELVVNSIDRLQPLGRSADTIRWLLQGVECYNSGRERKGGQFFLSFPECSVTALANDLCEFCSAARVDQPTPYLSPLGYIHTVYPEEVNSILTDPAVYVPGALEKALTDRLELALRPTGDATPPSKQATAAGNGRTKSPYFGIVGGPGRVAKEQLLRGLALAGTLVSRVDWLVSDFQDVAPTDFAAVADRRLRVKLCVAVEVLRVAVSDRLRVAVPRVRVRQFVEQRFATSQLSMDLLETLVEVLLRERAGRSTVAFAALNLCKLNCLSGDGASTDGDSPAMTAYAFLTESSSPHRRVVYADLTWILPRVGSLEELGNVMLAREPPLSFVLGALGRAGHSVTLAIGQNEDRRSWGVIELLHHLFWHGLGAFCLRLLSTLPNVPRPNVLSKKELDDGKPIQTRKRMKSETLTAADLELLLKLEENTESNVRDARLFDDEATKTFETARWSIPGTPSADEAMSRLTRQAAIAVRNAVFAPTTDVTVKLAAGVCSPYAEHKGPEKTPTTYSITMPWKFVLAVALKLGPTDGAELLLFFDAGWALKAHYIEFILAGYPAADWPPADGDFSLKALANPFDRFPTAAEDKLQWQWENRRTHPTSRLPVSKPPEVLDLSWTVCRVLALASNEPTAKLVDVFAADHYSADVADLRVVLPRNGVAKVELSDFPELSMGSPTVPEHLELDSVLKKNGCAAIWATNRSNKWFEWAIVFRNAHPVGPKYVVALQQVKDWVHNNPARATQQALPAPPVPANEEKDAHTVSAPTEPTATPSQGKAKKVKSKNPDSASAAFEKAMRDSKASLPSEAWSKKVPELASCLVVGQLVTVNPLSAAEVAPALAQGMAVASSMSGQRAVVCPMLLRTNVVIAAGNLTLQTNKQPVPSTETGKTETGPKDGGE